MDSAGRSRGGSTCLLVTLDQLFERYPVLRGVGLAPDAQSGFEEAYEGRGPSQSLPPLECCECSRNIVGVPQFKTPS